MRKEYRVIIYVAAVILAFVLGFFVVEPVAKNLRKSGSKQETQVTETTEATEETRVVDTSPSTQEFSELFTSNGITWWPHLTDAENTMTFAKLMEDGTIDVLEYAYEGDVVTDLVNVLYIPIYDYTDQQKRDIENTIKEQFDPWAEDGYCKVDYEVNYGYFILTLEYNELDDIKMLKKLEEAGAPTVYNEKKGYISIKEDKKTHLDDGYVIK